MTEDEIWKTETALWTSGPTHYRRVLDPQCVMAFSAPAGIMSYDAIMASLEKMPRWTSIEMAERHVQRPSDAVIVVAYKAIGMREGEKPYNVFCTSSYCRTDEGWRLVQHQQSPA